MLNPVTGLQQGLRLDVFLLAHVDSTDHLTLLSRVVFNLLNHALLFYTAYDGIMFFSRAVLCLSAAICS